jgi:1-acyl-sn-glycerol-3-phosphate acyltransferase
VSRFNRLVNLFFRLCFWILFDYYVEGLEKVPRHGALIVAINHFSFVDPLMAGTFIQRPLAMMGKAEIFRVPILSHMARMYGAIPVHRGRGDHKALRQSLEVLQSNGAMLIAPEGTRGKEGTLKPGREGIALLALHANAPIIPVAIWGPKTMWRDIMRLRRTKIYMVVGQPFQPRPPVGRRADRTELVALTNEIMVRIATLLPVEYRGVYASVNAEENLISSG